jgi:hypothetical protein
VWRSLKEPERLLAVAHQHILGLLSDVVFVELLGSMLRPCRVHDGPLGVDLLAVVAAGKQVPVAVVGHVLGR